MKLIMTSAKKMVMEGEIKLLDHGYVKLIDYMGDDEDIVESARMSTGKGFQGWGVEETCDRCRGRGTNEPENGPGSLCKQCQGRKVFVNKPGDEKLLASLYENRHDTPFEMEELKIEVKAPIMVFREWHRHRTQSYNEMSARYIPLPDESYIPTVERLMVNANQRNRQANRVEGAPELTEDGARAFQVALDHIYKEDERIYRLALASGVPKELARVHLPVGRYSRMRAKGNLRNWLGFMTLRSDNNAQWEIRQYAFAVGHIISQLFPRTWELFLNHERKKPVIDHHGFMHVLEAA